MALSDEQRFGIGAGLGNLAGGIAGLLGGKGKNPATTANQYISNIPNYAAPYLLPYQQYGASSLPVLQSASNQLLTAPGQTLNNIGASFHESPGFNFALQRALEGANRAAAVGGLAGSPSHQLQNEEIATQLANQDYYNYLNHAQNLFGQGLQGHEFLASGGQQAGTNLADLIAQTLAQQGQLNFAGQAAQNQQKGSNFSNIASGLGSLAAFLPFGNILSGLFKH